MSADVHLTCHPISINKFASILNSAMNNERAPSFLALPPEILCQVVLHLSRYDLSNCVRVSKTWNDAFMDSLWHTVELRYICTPRLAFERAMLLYGPYLVGRGSETVAAKSPFLRNLHRIRVLKVQYTSFLKLFCDHGAMLLETIPLEELSIDFEDDPKLPQPRQPLLTECDFSQSQPAQEPPEPTDMEAVLQILRRSTRLSTFTFIASILSRKGQLEDQARLLASLPASLETLNIT